MKRKYQYKNGPGISRLFSRGKMLLGCLLFVLAMGVNTVASHLAGAAPTYSATDALGQPSLTTNASDDADASATSVAFPFAVSLDSVHHRLFVSDPSNNRVVVYNLDSSNQLVDKTADFVIGQTDLSSSVCGADAITPTAANMCQPSAIAYDSVRDRLFVSDEENARVLVYDTSSLSNGMAAENVLGQSDFISNDQNVTRAGMDCPTGLAYDSTNDRLFVSDGCIDRVTVYDTSSITDGENASNVLGQSDFTSSGNNVTQSGLNCPNDLAYDSTNDRLFVADGCGARVMVFDTSSISDGENASNVLGQSVFTTNGQNTTQAGTVCPTGLAYDSTNNRLFLSDNCASRITSYDTSSITDGENASNVLGQSDFTGTGCNTTQAGLCQPNGMAVDGTNGQLWVTDTSNNRLMLFDTSSISDGENATDQLGQADFTSSLYNGVVTPNANGLDEPDVTAIDSVGHHLYVADSANDRVIMYNLDSTNHISDKTAAYVLGQSDFASYNSCNGSPTTTMCFPMGLALDTVGHHLYVSDINANRVLMYNLDSSNVPLDNTPDYVLGQTDFSGLFCNQVDGPASPSASTLCEPAGLALDTTGHHLYVADSANSRVLVFDLDSSNVPLDKTADNELGSGDFTANDCSDGTDCLNQPMGLAVDTIHHLMYVGDVGLNRVTMYPLDSNNVPTQDDEAATVALGQPDLQSTDCNQGGTATADTLCEPSGLAIDPAGQKLFVADYANDRVLVYDLGSDGTPQDGTADGVIGQTDFTTADQNTGCNIPAADNLCGPSGAFDDPGLAFDPVSGQLFVPDTFNNRVLAYNIGVSQTADTDSDGLPDAIENAGPNGGDANGDGILDSQQTDVTSQSDPVTGKYAVLQTSCTDNLGVQVGGESSQDKDAAFDYPAGLVGFIATGCGSPGVTATITEYFYGNFTASQFVMRKWSAPTYTTIPGATFSNVTVGGQAALKVVYQVKDGSSFDLDGATDGNIKDPAGPALNTATTPNTGLGGAAYVKD